LRRALLLLAGTLRVLLQLKDKFGDRVELVTFGCSESALSDLLQTMRMSGRLGDVRHHGVLDRDGVARLFGRSDVFLDGSFWQAFGRTGLEAMAAGCVPVLPTGSGSEEYANHGANALLVDATEESSMFAATSSVVSDRALLERLRAAAVETAQHFDMTQASWTMLKLLCGAIHGDITPATCRSATTKRLV